MANLLFPWIPEHLATHAKPPTSGTPYAAPPARNGCDCECHDPANGVIMHVMDCCPATPPSTIAQQVAAAQAEVATWPTGLLERVLPRKGDQS